MLELTVGLLMLVVIILILLGKKLDELSKTRIELDVWRDKYNKTLSQKKSSEIRVGKIGENMAPFLSDWPYDPNKFRFLGNPVDGIQFTDDEIIFVEIKTGKSRLTRGQKNLKNMVMEGKVKFATFRISENGAAMHMVENEDECDCEELEN